jgi:hypothetical protein
VTTADLLELRKLILGIDEQLNTNESWKFLTAGTEFDNPYQPWNFDYKYITDSLYFGLDSLDFIAVKIGDLNRSATIYNPASGLKYRNEPVKNFVVSNSLFEKDDLINVPVKVENFETLTGFQFTFEFDPDVLSFNGIENSKISLSSSNMNLMRVADGIITFSWNDGKGVSIKPEEELFRFRFKAVSKGSLDESVSISSKLTKAEIYDEVLSVSGLNLRFEGRNYENMNVYQNSPNPFSEGTDISFYLPYDDLISFKVFNSTGKTYINNQGHYSKGQNTITISNSDLDEPGVYFYEIKNNKTTVLKKMILIK